jgi:hypothetical protein
MPTQRIAVRIPKVLNTLLLDMYPNAAVAYSLRKLRNTYTGNAIRVRRSSDNAEQDITFSGNELDTTSMLDFVGYNIWTYSEDISNAVYQKTNLNTTGTPAYIDVETAPDGNTTGDKIIENTATGNHFFNTGGFTTFATNYNVSLYLKQGERTKVQIQCNFDGTYKVCNVDLTNGAISNNTFVNTPVVTAEANGWYRFSVTILATALTGRSLRVYLNNGTSISYTGDGTSGAYVWGVQYSQTSTVKTYQKTEATVGGSGFVTTWYDQSGNGKNSTQSTAANQPRIVNAGVLDTVNDKTAILGDGSNDTLFVTGLVLTNPSSIFTVVDKVGTSGYFGLITGANTLGGAFGLNATGYTFYQNGTTFTPTYANNNQSLLVAKTSTTGTNWEFYGNNTTVTNGGQNIGTTIGSRVYLFDRYGVSSRANMYMQEYIIWSSDQMTNRLPIQTNINSYYNIY